MTPSNEEKDRITAQAIEWYQRLEADSGEAIEDRFAEWLRQSPHHLPSFLKQAQIEKAMRHIRAARGAHAEAAAQHGTVARAQTAAPVDLVHVATRPAWSATRVLWKPLAIAASIVLFIAAPLTTLWAWRTAPVTTHITQITAQVVTLPDGSSATLAPHSQLTAKDLAGFTEVKLLRGGAQFRVHHRDGLERHWQRFRVLAGSAVITATGTEFNVLHSVERVGVYVTSGGVVVEGRAPKSNVVQRIPLVKGQSADVSAQGVIGRIESARPRRSAHDALFNNVSLATLVADLNRRNRLPQIVVEGSARRKQFREPEGLDDPEAWVAALSTYPDLEIERRSAAQVVIRGVDDARSN